MYQIRNCDVSEKHVKINTNLDFGGGGGWTPPPAYVPAHFPCSPFWNCVSSVTDYYIAIYYYITITVKIDTDLLIAVPKHGVMRQAR